MKSGLDATPGKRIPARVIRDLSRMSDENRPVQDGQRRFTSVGGTGALPPEDGWIVGRVTAVSGSGNTARYGWEPYWIDPDSGNVTVDEGIVSGNTTSFAGVNMAYLATGVDLTVGTPVLIRPADSTSGELYELAPLGNGSGNGGGNGTAANETFLGRLNFAGNLGNLGNVACLTVNSANGAVANGTGNLNFSFNVANVTFPANQTLGLLTVAGGGNVAFPVVSANRTQHGWVTTSNQPWSGCKTADGVMSNGASGTATAGNETAGNTGGLGSGRSVTSLGVGLLEFSNSTQIVSYGNTTPLANLTASGTYYGPWGWKVVSYYDLVGASPISTDLTFEFNRRIMAWNFYGGAPFGGTIGGPVSGGFIATVPLKAWVDDLSLQGITYEGNTGTITQGATCRYGLVINAGNGTPFGTGNGSVTSVDASSTWNGTSFSGGPVTGNGTLTLGIDDAEAAIHALGGYTQAEVDTLIAGLQSQIDDITDNPVDVVDSVDFGGESVTTVQVYGT